MYYCGSSIINVQLFTGNSTAAYSKIMQAAQPCYKPQVTCMTNMQLHFQSGLYTLHINLTQWNFSHTTNWKIQINLKLNLKCMLIPPIRIKITFFLIWSHFRPCKVFQHEFVFHTLTAILKCLMPPKNLCPIYSILTISPFEFFVSFCCVFIQVWCKIWSCNAAKDFISPFS